MRLDHLLSKVSNTDTTYDVDCSHIQTFHFNFVGGQVIQNYLEESLPFGPIAQLVEHRVDNAGVSGSSPLGPTTVSVVASIGL